MLSGEVTTVSNDDRLFVSAGFASWVRRFGACVCRVCVHVAATPRRPFLVVRVAFFPCVGWGGAALLLLAWRGYLCGGWVSCAFGSCPLVGCVWRLWSCSLRGGVWLWLVFMLVFVVRLLVAWCGAARKLVRVSSCVRMVRQPRILVRWRRVRRFSLIVMLRRVAGLLCALSAGPSARASILPPASCLPVRCAPSQSL